MKKVLVVLLFFLSITVNAMPEVSKSKEIDLAKHASSTQHKGQRSLDILAISAFFDSNNESILICNQDYSADITISIINIFGGMCIYSEKDASTTKNIELNLFGLLNEGSSYRLEITVGDTIFYGDFSF